MVPREIKHSMIPYNPGKTNLRASYDQPKSNLFKHNLKLRVFKMALTESEVVVILGFNHRDKTRVQMLAKMFPHLKLLCCLFMGPILGFDTKQRNSFLIKFGVFFLQKNKILTILFIVKYERITL
jgi:hypothetical protein